MKYGVLVLTVLAMVIGCSGMQQEIMEPQLATVKVQVEAKDPAVVKPCDKQHVGEEVVVHKGMEVDNPEIKLSSLSFIAGDKVYTKIFSGLSVSDVTRFWNDGIYTEVNNYKEISVFINSPGGDAFSGIALADQIERLKNKGIKVIGHASGIIASAAVPVFASCSERYAAPGTIFMVHEAALWKWPGRETASDIRSQNELMQLLRTRYIGILVNNSTTEAKDWESMEGATTWFDSDRAMELGIVDKIQ